MVKRIFLIISMFNLTNFISAQHLNIIDFGALGDNLTINTTAIQNAIDSCAAKGGGTVYIPAGIFLTGTLELKSCINLYLARGSQLKGSSNIDDYRPYKSAHYDSTHFGILYAHNAQNISITGQGVINGNEEAFFDWQKAKKIEWGGVAYTRQKENFRAVESGIGDGPVVAKLRPAQMVLFSECSNVLIRDVQINKSPYFSIHLVDCDRVVVSGVKIWTSLETPNSDGLHMSSCTNVTVSDCDIRTGDDAIAITGFSTYFELPGFHDLRHESKNITIANCNLQSRSSGIRIGFIGKNTIRNVHFSNINITNSNRGIGIFVRDEHSVENITFSQVSIETRLHTGDWWGNGEPIHLSAVRGIENVPLGRIRNITFRDITCIGESGILLFGSKESVIEDVRFENLRFTLRDSKLNEVAGGNIDLRGALGEKQLFSSDISAFHAQYVKDLDLTDVVIKWGNVREKYFKNGVHIKEFAGIRLMDVVATASPAHKELPPVFIENGNGFRSNLQRKFYRVKNIKE